MKRNYSQSIVYVTVAVAAMVIILVVAAVISAEHRDQANAKVQKEIQQQTETAHTNALSWQARLPEVYTISMIAAGKPKTTPTGFRYTLVKNAQTLGKEAVVADEVDGPISVDQSDASIMPDNFKCFWLSPCQELAKDAAGDIIYSSQESNNFSYYYGLVKGKSIIRLTARKAMTQADVVAVANSLKLAAASERQHLR
jgi:hypothetical protein